MKKPACYATPLRSRKDIIDWIFENVTGRGGYDYDNAYRPFCFNVKMHGGVRLHTYEQMLARWQQDNKNQSIGVEFSEAESDACRKVYEAMDEDRGLEQLFDMAVEEARTRYNDADHFLCGGTEVKVTVSFQGRSGGWLSLDSFQGHIFAGADPDELRVYLAEEMDYKTLRQLYQFIVQLDHDTRDRKNEIEYLMASRFFCDHCRLARDAATQEVS